VSRPILLAGLALSTFASQAIWVTYAPVTSIVAEELGVSKEAVGALAIVYPVLFLALTVPSGILLDRNFRLWLSVGVVLTGLAGALRLLYPRSYAWLMACQVMAGIGQPFLLNSFALFASRMYPEKRDAAVSVLSFAMYLGIIYALGTGYYIYTRMGLEALNLPVAAVSVAGLLLYLPATGILASEGGTRASGYRVLGGLRSLSRRRDLWLLGILLGLGVALFDNMSIWLEAALAPAGLSDVAGISMAMALLAGLAGVAVIPSRVARAGKRAAYIRLAAFTATMIYATLALVAGKVTVQILIPIAGLVMLPGYPIIMEWISTFYERDLQGKAAGIIGLISRVFTVVLASAAVAFLSGPTHYFAFLASLSAVAVLVALLLPSDR